MKEIYEMDVFKLSEDLSDIIRHSFGEWPEKVRKTIGYQNNRRTRPEAECVHQEHEVGDTTPCSPSVFHFPISSFKFQTD